MPNGVRLEWKQNIAMGLVSRLLSDLSIQVVGKAPKGYLNRLNSIEVWWQNGKHRPCPSLLLKQGIPKVKNPLSRLIKRWISHLPVARPKGQTKANC
eukprot:symbB.v1.2.027358.t1/scaffold2799.1/size70062/7